MQEQPKGAGMANELAKERSREASDRTLMAWIRTSISLIGFGFAIAKGYEYAEAHYLEKTGKVLDAIHSPVIFGAAFIALGIFALIAAVIQYGRILNRIKSGQFTYTEPLPLPKIMAILLLIVGAFATFTFITFFF